MKKYALNMRVVDSQKLNDAYGLLKMAAADGVLTEEIFPGQFVQVDVPDSKTTYLRRPISINFVDREKGELWLLIRNAGAGTKRLIDAAPGEVLNVILPLGNGFSIPEDPRTKVLLVGGGVGVAPLLYLGKVMNELGFEVRFALGARSDKDLLQLEEFARYGTLYISTEDASLGEPGFITQHSVFSTEIDHIACCGPTPMMKAVARIAHDKGINCEVSLENMMACGLGACLCCVEDTADQGNVCVCTDGPVFNINRLKWQL